MTTPPLPGPQRLRVGFVPGVITTKWATIWRERFRGVPLDLTEVAQADQRRALADDEVDLCFVRLPLETDGLNLIRLYQEVPVVWVAKEHPLAAFDEVSTADLAGEDVREEATAENVDLVALEVAVLRVPMSIARSQSRRDLVYRPVTDAEATSVGLAWRADHEHPLIDEFIGVVRGRTANSSRSAQARGAAAEPAKPARPARPAKPLRRRQERRPRRS